MKKVKLSLLVFIATTALVLSGCASIMGSKPLTKHRNTTASKTPDNIIVPRKVPTYRASPLTKRYYKECVGEVNEKHKRTGKPGVVMATGGQEIAGVAAVATLGAVGISSMFWRHGTKLGMGIAALAAAGIYALVRGNKKPPKEFTNREWREISMREIGACISRKMTKHTPPVIFIPKQSKIPTTGTNALALTK